MDLFADFDAERCTQCGECFHQCPVMHLPVNVAKAEIARLLAGEKTRIVEKKCTSCFSCNLICPEQCNPAQAIIDLWHIRSQRDGIPVRAMYYIPDSALNFRTYVLNRMPADEKALVRSWEDTTPCEEIFYPGCNIITVPYLTRTKLLEGMNIRGSLDLCCGETYYRTGQYELVEKAANRLQQWHDKLGFKRMIIACTAGRNMFTNVLPKFGVKPDFEVQHLLPLLLERFEKGEFEIVRSLNMKVTVQESCYGKFFGDDYMDIPRKLLQIAGATVIEEDLCRQNALCCGIAGGFSYASSYNPTDITFATMKTLGLAKKTGAQAIAAYCAGCLQMLTVGQILIPNRMPVYHILELLQMAIGEQPERRHKSRARTMFKGVAIHQFPKVVSRKRFFAGDLV